MESFLIDANATAILHENKTTGELSEKSRRKLIKYLHEYLKETYGDKETQNDKISLAKATIRLFPSLKTHESEIDGIVSSSCVDVSSEQTQPLIYRVYMIFSQDLLFNHHNGGYLGLKERNHRRLKRKSEVLESDQSDQNITEDLEYLKSAIVNADNMDTIRKKLKSTERYRMEMVRDLNVDLLENFPFFFTHPETVILFDIISE